MDANSGALVWDRDGRDWPARETSRFVRAGGLSWHVQVSGEGPPALLLHGTGASTHSWAWLTPYLRGRFTLIAPDLPGHAFSGALPAASMTVPGMAAAVCALLTEMGVRPRLVIGNSAGAAILVQMALDADAAGAPSTGLLIAVNGALTPFTGATAHVFPALARLLFVNPLASRFLAWRAGRGNAVERLLVGTGSHVPPESLAIYARLFRSPQHCAAALAMMANWDLDALHDALPALRPPLVQIVGGNDLAVPSDLAFQIARRVPGASTVLLRGAGHLAHEEQPARVAEAILAAAARLEAEGALV